MLKRHIVVVILCAVACGCGGKTYGTKATAAAQQAGDTIANGAFDIAARTFKPITVTVPAGVANPRIEGTFTASGGSGDDIEVTVLEQSQFLNWQNRHQFTPIYQSGRITADRIRISLPANPASYVMVFSNRFSLLSAKGVTADLKLRYDPVKK
jgi:hypothetical protein